MQYGEFASVYDVLMRRDIDYPAWCDYIENLLDRYGAAPDIVCDLACGTGNITTELARRGYNMIGVDISTDMLDLARSKAEDEGLDILYLNQDMAELDLYGTAGAFVCMIDGINYMLSPKKIKYLFKRIKTCFIDSGGVFIFDISTRHKLKNIIGGNTFTYDDGGVFYSWENKYSERANLSKMNLTFFERMKGGLYRRFDEQHLQRAHTEEELRGALYEAGFSEVDVYGELSFDAPSEQAQRIVFAARA